MAVLLTRLPLWCLPTPAGRERASSPSLVPRSPSVSPPCPSHDPQFGTSFKEMDALSGRSQTTRGVWLAPAPRISEPLTLVMDLEGTDGRERGEDDTSFERQSALFALAVADVVVVNMWAKDVGRESGSGKPLLKTIFQVNLKLFQPAAGQRRTVLLFVFRDRTRTPLDLLRSTWEVDLVRMWEGIAKPPAYDGLPLTDFFEVQYAALANFEDRADDFRAETHLLRRRFTDEGKVGLGRGSRRWPPGADGRLPGWDPSGEPASPHRARNPAAGTGRPINRRRHLLPDPATPGRQIRRRCCAPTPPSCRALPWP